MRLLQNGKLFGILNLLDIAIIVIILGIILPMVHYYMVFNEKGLAEQKLLDRFISKQARSTFGFATGSPKEGFLFVNASFKNISREDIKNLKAGDKDMTKDGTVIAEIVGLGTPEPNYFLVDLGNAVRKVKQDTGADTALYSVPVRLRLKGVIGDNGAFYYKTKPVRNLGLYTFDTGMYTMDFVIQELLPGRQQ